MIPILPVLAVISFLNVALGVIVFSQHPRSRIHSSFFGLCLSFVTWGVAIALMAFTADVRYARVSFIAGAGIGYSFAFFSAHFPYRFQLPTWAWVTAAILWLPFIVIAPTELILKQYQPTQIVGPFFFWYAFYLGAFLIWGLVNLVLQLARARSAAPDVRRQIHLVAFGFAVTLSLSFLTNVALPLIQGEPLFVQYGPMFPVVFIGVTAVAILRYQLFALKVIIAEFLFVLLALFAFADIFSAVATGVVLFKTLLFLGVVVVGLLLVRSVRKEVALREQLAIANAQLRSLNELKTEFLSLATHQMRTPMSITKGYVELLKRGAYGALTAKTKEVVTAIGKANDLLIELIDEFLNISRIEQGRLRYEFTAVQPHDVLREVIGELTPKAEEKRLTLNVVQNAGGIPTVTADRDKLRHMMFNLVDNAIRYTPAGRIDIALRTHGDGIEFTVRDTGIGFAPEDARRLFEKFMRGQNVRSVHVDGTGLGLYMAKKFVEAHGGRIWGKSNGVNQGSEFGFWLPTDMVATRPGTTEREGSSA